ncbi:hypothetical protein ACO0RG_001238 [Hanseniaspora osmophila]
MEDQEKIQALINENPHYPVVLTSINTSNLPFNATILRDYVQHTIQNATTMAEYIQHQQIFNEKLISNGLVENVDQNLTVQLLNKQTPKPLSSSMVAQSVPPLGLSPYYQFTPVKKFSAKTGSKIGNGEGDGYLEFQLRNYFGTGEKFIMDVQKGTKTKSSVLLQYQQPFKVWYNTSLSFFQNNRKVSGCTYELSGLKFDFLTSYHRFSGKHVWNHAISFESCARTMKNNSRMKSLSVLFQCQEDWKNSLTYTISNDTRDNHVSPTMGHLLKFSNELEVTTLWNKFQLEASKATSTILSSGRQVSFIGTLKGGTFASLATASPYVPYIDKFQNGGGNDIRGFDFMGLGDKDHVDSLGGNHYMSYGLSMMCPLKPGSNFKWHLFFNGGKLCNNAEKLVKVQEHSTAIGFGILYSHPSARFELNFTLPISASETDLQRKGFQYGLGMSFL